MLTINFFQFRCLFTLNFFTEKSCETIDVKYIHEIEMQVYTLDAVVLFYFSRENPGTCIYFCHTEWRWMIML